MRLLVGWGEDGASFALSPESHGWIRLQPDQILPARVHLMGPQQPERWDELARDAAILLTGLSVHQLEGIEVRLGQLPEADMVAGSMPLP